MIILYVPTAPSWLLTASAYSAICIELNRVDTKPSGSQLSVRERH
jgi:hypothetical protein